MTNHDSSDGSWVILALAAIAVACAFVAPTKARAHDWYPMECCHGMDCAEVTTTAQVQLAGEALPSLVITTKHGTVVVPRNHPWRESKDGRMHACMRPGSEGQMRLICIFAPPSL